MVGLTLIGLAICVIFKVDVEIYKIWIKFMIGLSIISIPDKLDDLYNKKI